jgi:hypothetical protein
MITCEVIAALGDPFDSEAVDVQDGLRSYGSSSVKRYPSFGEEFTKESASKKRSVPEEVREN